MRSESFWVLDEVTVMVNVSQEAPLAESESLTQKDKQQDDDALVTGTEVTDASMRLLAQELGVAEVHDSLPSLEGEEALRETSDTARDYSQVLTYRDTGLFRERRSYSINQEDIPGVLHSKTYYRETGRTTLERRA